MNIRKVPSQAKVLGTAVTFGGAMIMALVKGPNIGLPWIKETHFIQTATALHSQQDIIKGAVLIIAACFFWASFFILQVIYFNILTYLSLIIILKVYNVITVYKF